MFVYARVSQSLRALPQVMEAKPGFVPAPFHKLVSRVSAGLTRNLYSFLERLQKTGEEAPAPAKGACLPLLGYRSSPQSPCR